MIPRSIASLLVFIVAACAETPRDAAAPSQGAGSIAAVARAPAAASPPRIAMTAHPLATRAALDMLDRGGNAIDAIVAAQMVLGLVEPQMSGIAGGTVILYWDAASRKLTSFDGLSSAPARTTSGVRIDVDGKVVPRQIAYHSGRSFAVPGTLPVLQMVHRRYGKLPWSALFQPAIENAERGFHIPEYLRRIIGMERITLRGSPDLAMYFDAEGNALPMGEIVHNPEYARTLRHIAARGAEGLLADGGAERIVEAARRGALPTLMTPADLREYQPVERAPICGPFLAYRLCTVGPPSYGGIYLLQVLAMVEARAGGRYDFDDPQFVHLFVEAGRLARADRAMYVGDPDFSAVPTLPLIAPAYTRSRAASIDLARANPSPQAGRPAAGAIPQVPGREEEMGGTSQLTIADAAGNIVSMTTTINLGFGARIMVDGFVLNDALINFSAPPSPGQLVANAMAPRKRPLTSMAPSIVFDASGNPVAAGGSAGGGRIPDYVSQGWIEILANDASPARALARGHVSTADPGHVLVEKDTEAELLVRPLRALGHQVMEGPLLSGAGYIKRMNGGWIGAADPRRGGNAASE
jgi:gamma-glutamyltranspeptidase / glutathione hydrolase